MATGSCLVTSILQQNNKNNTILNIKKKNQNMLTSKYFLQINNFKNIYFWLFKNIFLNINIFFKSIYLFIFAVVTDFLLLLMHIDHS